MPQAHGIIVGQLLERRLIQAQATRQLGITPRQVRRLLVRYGAEGPAGLVSRKRRGVGNRSKPDALKARFLEIVRESCADFGPTLVAENLVGRHAITVSWETVRRWMLEACLRVDPKASRIRAYQPKYRRDYFGELTRTAPG